MVDAITLISIERKETSLQFDLGPKVQRVQYESSDRVWNKMTDRVLFDNLLNRIFKYSKPDFVISRTSLAAYLVQLFVSKHHIPFSVESFEPHVDYMVEAGVWRKNGLRASLLYRSEKFQKLNAEFLLPLTQAYSSVLLMNDNVPSASVEVMPCCVNIEQFQFKEEHRIDIRSRLSIKSDDIVGVYTGKIGGIYLDQESIKLFSAAKKYYQGKFHLLILSPDKDLWEVKLKEVGFSEGEYSLGFVSQNQVNKYLSAADFAFSLHRPTPSKIGISPMKNAEFWANGLPIVMPYGIGDDSELVIKENIGAVIDDFDKIDDEIFKKIDRLRALYRKVNDCVRFARENRSFEIVRGCYSNILASIKEKGV